MLTICAVTRGLLHVNHSRRGSATIPINIVLHWIRRVRCFAGCAARRGFAVLPVGRASRCCKVRGWIFNEI